MTDALARPQPPGAAAGPHTGRPAGALVVGGDPAGLGVARSLGRRGSPVCVIDDEPSIARFSRYVRRSLRVADLRDPEAAVDAVLEIGTRLGLDGWVLLPARDELVAAFSVARERLERVFRVPVPPWDVTRWAWDKRNTHALADRLGIPTPRTWPIQDASDVHSIEGEGPFAVRPAIDEHFAQAGDEAAWRAAGRAALAPLVARAADLCGPGEVMVQEIVPGDGRHRYSFCAFFKEGRAIGAMTVRRSGSGSATTKVETVDEPEVEATATALLREMGWYGVAEVEMERDARDGRLKLLGVHARTWGYPGLGRRAGADFPAMLFADQAGDAVEPRRARPGVRCIRLLAAAREVARGRLSPIGFVRLARSADAESVLTRDDPLPAFAGLAIAAVRGVRRAE